MSFIEKTAAIIEKNNTGFLNELEDILRELIQTKSWLSIEKQVPDDKKYARHSLYQDPMNRFEVLALVWKKGQKTPLHDHDGTWGIEGVVCGRIYVQNFVQTKQIAGNLFELQHTESISLGVGETDQILPPADCHIIEVDKKDIAITIHVYGKKLERFQIFEPTNKQNIYMSRYYNATYNSQ